MAELSIKEIKTFPDRPEAGPDAGRKILRRVGPSRKAFRPPGQALRLVRAGRALRRCSMP